MVILSMLIESLEGNEFHPGDCCYILCCCCTCGICDMRTKRRGKKY